MPNKQDDKKEKITGRNLDKNYEQEDIAGRRAPPRGGADLRRAPRGRPFIRPDDVEHDDKRSAMFGVHEVSKLFHDLLHARSREIGMRRAYGPILRLINMHDGIVQSEIAKYTHLKAPTISTTIQNMEQAGLVRREEDMHDARMMHVYATRHGKDLNASMKQNMERIFGETFEGLNDDEISFLNSTLEKMRNNLIKTRGDNIKYDDKE